MGGWEDYHRPHLLGSGRRYYCCKRHASRNSDTPAHNLRTLSLSPTTSAPLDCPPYLHPTPAVVRVAPRHRPAAAVGQLAIVAISCLLHVKYCILSTLQRRDETMLCAVLPCLLRRRNSVPPLCLVRLQRCPHG
jgi:hypothetical protein